MNTKNTFFLVIVCCILNLAVSFKALGSEPKEKCSVTGYDCPSHYICVHEAGSGLKNTDHGICVCNRVYGFWGPECRDLTVTSYFLVGLSTATVLLGIGVLIYHLCLMYYLHKMEKFKANIWVPLLFSSCSVLSIIGLTLGFIVTVLEIDKRMFYHEHLRSIFLAAVIFCFQLSSLTVSLYWVEISEKVSGKKTESLKYKFFLYGSTVSSVLIALCYFARFQTLGPVTMLGPITVIFTYHYGSKMVVGKLNGVHKVSGDMSTPGLNALELANAISYVASATIKWNTFLIVCVVALTFTIMSPNPLYRGQNELPRWCQGQIAMFLIFMGFYASSVQVAQYFHFVAFRDLFEYVPLKDHRFIDVLRNFSVPKNRNRDYTSTIEPLDEDSFSMELTPSSRAAANRNQISSGMGTVDVLKSDTMIQSSFMDPAEVFLMGPQQIGPDGKRMVCVPLPGFNDPGTNGYSHVMMPTMMPLALVVLEPETNRLLSRVVIDYGDGKIIDYEDEEEDEEEGETKTSSKLSAGSHAFVRCYGESCLRCTLASFEFGNAGGHPLLASFSQVLMAGEVEVDEDGKLLRWINKSGLYMPPRFLIGQSGLPLELAWLYISEEEVMKMDETKRDTMIQSSCLLHIVHPLRQEDNTRATSVHAMDTWVVKVADDMVWQPSISTSAYNVAKESIARFRSLKREARQLMRQRRERHQVAPEGNKGSLKLAVQRASDSRMFTGGTGSGRLVLNDHLSLNGRRFSPTIFNDHLSLNGRRLSPAFSGTASAGVPDVNEQPQKLEAGKGVNIDQSVTDEEDEEEERRVMEKVLAMKREMMAAGLFDVHRQGAEERREMKAGHGFSRALQLG